MPMRRIFLPTERISPQPLLRHIRGGVGADDRLGFTDEFRSPRGALCSAVPHLGMSLDENRTHRGRNSQVYLLRPRDVTELPAPSGRDELVVDVLDDLKLCGPP